MYALRGAISVDQNNKDDILSATKELMEKLVEKNNLKNENLISIITTATDDLDKVYPGQALRDMGYNLTPILCMQEMKVENSSEKMIRLLLYVDENKDKSSVNHQYLKNAKKLRPDLVE